MATATRSVVKELYYPESDGKPMAETPIHMRIMIDVIETLIKWFANPLIYVWGNMFLYYAKGNTKKNVSPDVMVIKGVLRDKSRRVFKTWEEGASPNAVIEVTSRKTKKQDEGAKFLIYQDILKVEEYFLFDPFMEYLDPPLKGYRLVNGKYEQITEVNGRLPSEVMGLHLEARLGELRLYDPNTGKWLLTPREDFEAVQQKAEHADAARQQAEAARRQAEAALQEAEAAQRAEAAARQHTDAEVDLLRRELEALRQQISKQS